MRTHSHRPQSGFSIIEVLVATLILLFGIVAVAKMVPLAVGLNSANRADSTALVIAQREMDALLNQPLTNATFTDATGATCPAASVCDLGNSATPNVVVGSPVIMDGNRPLINFSAGKVAGYNFVYNDPNDPANAGYDARWAVISFTISTGRRLIVGVRALGANSPFLPVTRLFLEDHVIIPRDAGSPTRGPQR